MGIKIAEYLNLLGTSKVLPFALNQTKPESICSHGLVSLPVGLLIRVSL